MERERKVCYTDIDILYEKIRRHKQRAKIKIQNFQRYLVNLLVCYVRIFLVEKNLLFPTGEEWEKESIVLLL